ncbi:MAG: nitrate/nitrite transporter NrtS [Pseudomonadota bacterium]
MPFLRTALSRNVYPRALRVALVVGTLLMLINYGDRLFPLDLTGRDILKIVLTYLVPYGVSTWSAVRAIEAQETGSV